VPGFGDPRARLLIVGLAPAAHGANRTGRVFTGDRSGDFLFAALHRAGFANQPESRDAKDGLRLQDAFVTPIVRCAPPANKPTRDEILACRDYLEREWRLFAPRLRAVLVLGRIGMDGLLAMLRESGLLAVPRGLAFGHGVTHDLAPGLKLFCSYHPSQQNTFTGRLTPRTFDSVMRKINTHLNRAAKPAPRARGGHTW
jgi:uracil-DNA glycosylase family 4